MTRLAFPRLKTLIAALLSALGVFLAPAVQAAAAVETPLYDFSTAQGGYAPSGSLVLGLDGNFYGMTEYGGETLYCTGYPNCGWAPYTSAGTIFKMTPDGALTTIHYFDFDFNYGLYPTGGSNGAPPAGLTLGADGNLYGTTNCYGMTADGSEGYGTVFKITLDGVFTLLHVFTGADGSQPFGTLVQGTDGSFYGTTSSGGANGYGTVFKITSSGQFTSLYSFPGYEDNLAFPGGGLVQGDDGNFYGTTGAGYLCGAVFKITPTGVLTSLHTFSGEADDGCSPRASLTKGSDGNFYGTTQGAVDAPYGTVFNITPEGVFTNLHSFDGNDGGNPSGALTQRADGYFYGTTAGGSSLFDTVFRISSTGVFESLFAFEGGTGGDYPYASGVVEGANGNLYGVTQFGGSTSDVNYGDGAGVVYSLTVPAVIAPPTALTASGKSGKIKLSWKAPTGATSYNVYEGTSPGAESATPIATGVTKTKLTVKNLTGGDTYYFKVAAESATGSSGLSSEVSGVAQ